MTSMAQRPGPGLPDLLQWFESEWPFGGHQSMRVESYTEKEALVVRCELPGMDPENINIEVEGNHLTINAERRSEERSDRRTEFRYGAFTRSLLLPTNCNTEDITADYESGILTIHIPHREVEQHKQIPVSRSGK